MNKILYCAHLCKKSYSLSTFENEIGAQVYITTDNKDIYITFTGTNETKDWYSSLNFFDYDICEEQNVHFGYYKLYITDGINEKIINHIIEKNPKNIYITGHSMGGCLSQLLAQELYNKKKIRSTVIIFGTFMIGNYEFQKYLYKNSINVILVNIVSDIVPYIYKLKYKNYFGHYMMIPNYKKNNLIDSHYMYNYILYLETLYKL